MCLVNKGSIAATDDDEGVIQQLDSSNTDFRGKEAR